MTESEGAVGERFDRAAAALLDQIHVSTAAEALMPRLEELMAAAAERPVASLRNGLLEMVNVLLRTEDPAAFHALGAVFRALVLGGMDAEIVAPSVVHRLPWFFDLVGRFYVRLAELGYDARTQVAALQTASNELPAAAAAFARFEGVCQLAIELLCDAPTARERAGGNEALVHALDALAEGAEAARRLARLLRVSPPGELVVLAVAERIGFRVRAVGIADNVQLEVLLADAISDGLAGTSLDGPRPSRELVELFRGEGPQSIDATVRPRWTLFEWPALLADGTLPQPDTSASGAAGAPQGAASALRPDERRDDGRHHLWPGGLPADVPALEGARVLLLGPRTAARTDPASRYFAALRASVELLETLPRDAVDAWIARIVSAREGPEFARLEVRALAMQGILARDRGDEATALAYLRRALALAEARLAPDSPMLANLVSAVHKLSAPQGAPS